MSDHDPAPNRRRKLIVMPSLQRRLVRQCTAWPLTTFAFATVLVGFAWRQVLQESLELEPQLGSLNFLLGTYTTLIGVATFVILYQALVLSNRVAGPSYRVRKTLEAVRAGDLSVRVNLREQDLLCEMADELNRTLEVLQRRIEQAPVAAPPAVALEQAPSLTALEPSARAH